MLMVGASVAQDTEHGRAVTAQLTRRHGTLGEAIDAGIFGLSAAGVTRGIRRQARSACEDYFYERLGLPPDHVLQPLTGIAPGMAPLPDAMAKLLADVVELVVDGEYEELRELSHGRLQVEDLRRRVEDDCPEALVLPPPEVYRVEAVTRSEEPDDPDWTYFLELWTDDGPARLHIEGYIVEETDGRLQASFNDVLP
jgi:hypothetical protein